MLQPQKYKFWEKVPQNKKKYIIFPRMTAFYNFALKIETSWAKKVVKPILETWNASNVIVYALLIHSIIKNFKNMQYTKFTIKN